MSYEPLLSVCIITYNHGAYITQAIESVLRQKTNFPIEIIIGEDGSSDTTRDIVLGYRDRFPNKIRVLLGERKNVIYINDRPTGRRNLIDVLSAATGKYIARLEGDDFWIDPLKLQKQVDVMEAHPEYSVCGHWVINVGEDGEVLRPQIFTGESCPEIFSLQDAISGTPLHFNSLVFRRFNLIKQPMYPFLLKMPMADCPLMLMLLGQGNGYCLKERMSAYRIHSTGSWSAIARYHKEFELLQFRFGAIRYLDWRYVPWLLILIGRNIASLILNIAHVSVSTRALTPIKEFVRLIKIQKTIPPYCMVPLFLLGIVFLPLNVMKYIKRRITEHAFN